VCLKVCTIVEKGSRREEGEKRKGDIMDGSEGREEERRKIEKIFKNIYII
jgi:hypothetical protein